MSAKALAAELQALDRRIGRLAEWLAAEVPDLEPDELRWSKERKESTASFRGRLGSIRGHWLSFAPSPESALPACFMDQERQAQEQVIGQNLLSAPGASVALTSC